MSQHTIEVDQGRRFEFGKNWSRFIRVLTDERTAEAEKSIKQMLDVEDLKGKRFLDVGSGSGLFSLAARRLGAKVHSFDYDPQSVACTAELKRRYLPDDSDWKIEEGSVLDDNYLKSLGSFDIVYSWGVLHHTGEMWRAMENIVPLVVEGGRLFLAIYNDQGTYSKLWCRVKRLYCSSWIGRSLVITFYFPYFFCRGLIADIFYGRNSIDRDSEYKNSRGMSKVTDWIDWLGGYPFEVAKPEQIFEFYKERNCQLERLKTCGGNLGNNEFVFVKQ